MVMLCTMFLSNLDTMTYLQAYVKPIIAFVLNGCHAPQTKRIAARPQRASAKITLVMPLTCSPASIRARTAPDTNLGLSTFPILPQNRSIRQADNREHISNIYCAAWGYRRRGRGDFLRRPDSCDGQCATTRTRYAKLLPKSDYHRPLL